MGDEPKKPPYDPSTSRRTIDLYAAAEFARIDERLKALENGQKGNAERSEDIYGEVFGGPHGQIGLSETLRSVIKDSVRRWGFIASVMGMLAGATPWLIDKIMGVVNKPLVAMNQEQYWRTHGGKRIRGFNTDTGEVEFYYPEIRELKKVPKTKVEGTNG